MALLVVAVCKAINLAKPGINGHNNTFTCSTMHSTGSPTISVVAAVLETASFGLPSSRANGSLLTAH